MSHSTLSASVHSPFLKRRLYVSTCLPMPSSEDSTECHFCKWEETKVFWALFSASVNAHLIGHGQNKGKPGKKGRRESMQHEDTRRGNMNMGVFARGGVSKPPPKPSTSVVRAGD